MIFKYLKITLLAVVLCACGQSVYAQDLLVRQAPIDRKLKAIDSISILRQLKAEMAEYPAYGLYPEWSNAYAHRYINVTLPDSFKIDLAGFCMPTTHTKITSKFGPRRRRMHYGIDVKVYVGDTIRSAFAGKVRVVKNQGRRVGYGKYVIIRHENGLETVYGHLSKQLVHENQYVEAGEVIGLGGNTGRSSGSHLHFETRFLGQAINPAFMFDFEKQDIVADSYTFYKKAKRKNGVAVAGVDYYKVRKGDSLSRISKRTGVSVSTLCKLNGISTKTTLRVGQVLKCS